VCAIDACAVYVCGASHVGRVCMTASAWTVRAAWVSMRVVVRCRWSIGCVCVPPLSSCLLTAVLGGVCVCMCVCVRVCVACVRGCRVLPLEVLASPAVHRVRRRDTCRCTPCRVAVAVMASHRCSEWYAGGSRCDAVAATVPARDSLLDVSACCIVSWCVVGPCRVSLWRGVCHVVV
jgi:hypothetical protein